MTIIQRAQTRPACSSTQWGLGWGWGLHWVLTVVKEVHVLARRPVFHLDVVRQLPFTFLMRRGRPIAPLLSLAVRAVATVVVSRVDRVQVDVHAGVSDPPGLEPGRFVELVPGAHLGPDCPRVGRAPMLPANARLHNGLDHCARVRRRDAGQRVGLGIHSHGNAAPAPPPPASASTSSPAVRRHERREAGALTAAPTAAPIATAPCAAGTAAPATAAGRERPPSCARCASAAWPALGGLVHVRGRPALEEALVNKQQCFVDHVL